MEKMNATFWQYTPQNSPHPLPNSPFVCTNSEILPLEFNLDSTNEIQIDELKKSVSKAKLEEINLGQFLAANSALSMNDRMPILLLGELANPFQLSRLKLGVIPVIKVRINGLCRTYADGLDSRMIRPRIHHITLARTAGWWKQPILLLPHCHK